MFNDYIEILRIGAECFDLCQKSPMDKIPFQIKASKNGKIAKIGIIGEIGWDVDSKAFRKDVGKLVEEGCTEAQLYINSIGGSVFDANELVNILRENFTVIRGDGGAIVASAAAFIAAHCETFTMPSNGQFMIHRPKGSVYGSQNSIQSYLKMISDIDANYLAVFKQKATDPEDLEKRWESGSDYWMNAKEAQDAGFITSVRDKVNPDQETTSMLRACANETARDRMSEFLINNDFKMEQLAKLLNVSAKATEQDLVNAVQPILAENATLRADLQAREDEKKALQDKLDAIELAEKQAKTNRAKALIAEAIKDGRVDEDEKKTTEAFWLRNFEADFDGTKAQLERLPKKTNLSDRVDSGNQGGDAWKKRQREIEEKAKK